MVLPDGKIGTLRANEAAFLREMQASRAVLAARAAPPVLPAASSAPPAAAAALPGPATSAGPAAALLLLTEKPHVGATATPAPSSAAPAGASAIAAVPQFAGASEYLPETLPVTAAALNGGLPSLAGGLPGALNGVVLPGLFPQLMRPGLGPGTMPGLLPLGAQLVAGEKPLSFEEFNRLKTLAAVKQQQPASAKPPRSKARSRSRSPSRRRSPKGKDAKRRGSSRRDRSESRSAGRSRSGSKERRRKHHSDKGKDKESSRHHRSNSARHRKTEPSQPAAALDSVPKASGWDKQPVAEVSTALLGPRAAGSPTIPSPHAPRQRPPLGLTREFAEPQPRSRQSTQQPRPDHVMHAPVHGRSHDRRGRDASAPSHDRRSDLRDGAVRPPSVRTSVPCLAFPVVCFVVTRVPRKRQVVLLM